MDGSGLNEGDYAGICALQGCFGFIGLTRREGRLHLVVQCMGTEDGSMAPAAEGKLRELTLLSPEESVVRLKLEADFEEMRDKAFFYYKRIGEEGGPGFAKWVMADCGHKLRFRLDHFTGCRFGLTVFSTKEAGGSADFSDFVYRLR